MSKTQELGVEPIGKLLFKYSVPAIIAMMVNAIYNVVDRIFIGQFAGENALAGLTIAFPIMMLALAFASLIGSGASSIMSIKLGKGDMEGASKTFGNSITLGIITTVLLLLVLYPNTNFFLNLFGGKAELLPFASSYLKIILVGFVFQILSFILTGTIRLEGHPNLSMVSLLVGAVANIILDYVFIGVFKMGVQGAALATIVGQILSFIVIAVYYLRGKSILKYSLSDFKLDLKEVGRIISVGFTSFISTIGTSIASVFMNRALSVYGGTAAITSMGAISSLSTLFLMPMIGVQQGMQPIVGYNYGAKDRKRVNKTIIYSTIACTVFALIVFVAIRLFPTTLLSLFLDPTSSTISMAASGLKYTTMMLPILGLGFMGLAYFQSTAQSKKSILLGSLRQFILIIPIVLVLPMIYGLNGVWLTTPIADIISTILITIFLVKDMRRPYEKELGEEISIAS